MRTCGANNCNRVVFSTDKKTNIGYCQYHWKTHRTDLDKRSIIQKAQEKANKKNGVVVEVDETELQKWYRKIMNSEKAVCWETGEPISKQDEMGWHGSIAHCLPKSDYPSVATHPMNYMILKMWGGTHGQYDSCWEKAAKMRIWPYACKVFNILYPLLTREEKAKLPDIIVQEILPEKYNQ